MSLHESYEPSDLQRHSIERRRSRIQLLAGLGLLSAVACSGSASTDPVAASGGAVAQGSGGASGADGGSAAPPAGAMSQSGGTPQGGATPQGGSAPQGGAPPQGGTTPLGGAPPQGGTAPQGGGGPEAGGARVKPRVIVTTDGEVDDRSTMIRFLMYSTDYDVAGIVQVNSRYQKSGHSSEKWVEKELDLYDSVLPNLRKHRPDYPDAAKLRGVVRVGNENKDDLASSPPNFATKDTPGAQLIIDTLLDSDPRPVHVPSWGGANTTAYALWKLKTEYSKEKFDYAVSKIRVYCIWYQDSGGQWIEDNIPGALIYEAYGWDNVWDYQSVSGVSPASVKAYMTSEWLNANVKKNHGALGAYYPQSFVSEGDTPAFLFLIDNGLDSDRDYTLGGWGGRPRFDAGQHLTDGLDDGNVNKPFWRWIPTLQTDFAARMDWSVASSYSAANHNPEVRVAGERHRRVSPGEFVTLDGSSTSDPDGDNLAYKWWQYGEADSAAATISFNDSSTPKTSFVAPSEPGKQLNVILEVTDDGTPPLTRYQRVLFDIN